MSTSKGLFRARARKRGGSLRPRRLNFESCEERRLMTASPLLFTTGSLDDLTILAADDHGNTFDRATGLSLASDGSGSARGNIEQSGDVDLFRFTAAVSGTMTLRQSKAGSALDSYLYVYDSQRCELARNDDGGGNLNSLVQISVTAGQVYYAKAAAYGSSRGAYQLTLATEPIRDDHGNSFDRATNLSLSSSGSGSARGIIEQAGDVDMFRFTAAVSGTMTLRQSKAGSALDSYLYVYDSQGRELARNDDGGGNLNSLVQIAVTAGQTYYAKAAAYSSSTGAYDLTLATAGVQDDYGNSFADATGIAVAGDGSGSARGTIEQGGDVDMFRFVAPGNGRLIVRQSAAGSSLDSYLYVYDSQGQEIARNDDSEGLNSRVQLAVTAGRTYYIKAAAYGSSRGAYQVTLTPLPADDHGDTLQTATALQLDEIGTGAACGTIGQSGDVDMFRYVAPLSGTLVVRQTAAGSGLDSYVYVYDSQGRELARNDDSGGTLNSRVQLAVTAGQTYYIKAAAYGSGTGAYQISAGINQTDGTVQNAAGESSPVFLRRIGGLPIERGRTTWVVIHGRANTCEDMTALANAIGGRWGNDQVLVLDWRTGAAPRGFAGEYVDFRGEAFIRPVARWAADALATLGLRPEQINLVGHSWGAVAAGEIAARLPGGVNRLVALDPARDATRAAAEIALAFALNGYLLPGGGVITAGYFRTDPNYDTERVNFGDNSLHAWAFYSSDCGSATSVSTADFAIAVDASQVGLIDAHRAPVDWMTDVLSRSNPDAAAIDRFFDLDQLPAWRFNEFMTQDNRFRPVDDLLAQHPDSYYEALLQIRRANGHWGSTELTYASHDGDLTMIGVS